MSVFRQAVEQLIGNWTALQLAIEQGMGGPYAKEKELWMAGAVEDFFLNNNSLESDEIEDFLSQILNNEFDTLAEDGSVEAMTQKLTNYFYWFRTGETDRIANDLQVLATERLSNNIPPPVTLPDTLQSTSSCSITKELANQMEELNIDPDGWTIVARKKK